MCTDEVNGYRLIIGESSVLSSSFIIAEQMDKKSKRRIILDHSKKKEESKNRGNRRKYEGRVKEVRVAMKHGRHSHLHSTDDDGYDDDCGVNDSYE